MSKVRLYAFQILYFIGIFIVYFYGLYAFEFKDESTNKDVRITVLSMLLLLLFFRVPWILVKKAYLILDQRGSLSGDYYNNKIKWKQFLKNTFKEIFVWPWKGMVYFGYFIILILAIRFYFIYLFWGIVDDSYNMPYTAKVIIFGVLARWVGYRGIRGYFAYFINYEMSEEERFRRLTYFNQHFEVLRDNSYQYTEKYNLDRRYKAYQYKRYVLIRDLKLKLKYRLTYSTAKDGYAMSIEKTRQYLKNG